MNRLIGQEKAPIIQARLRHLSLLVLRGAVGVNMVCVIILLMRSPDVPAVVVYLPFYCLIWGVLPSAGIIGLVAFYRWRNDLPVWSYIAKQATWGGLAIMSYAILLTLTILH